MTRNPLPPDSTRPFGSDPSPPGDAEWEALARYLAGESSPEEADAIARRLATQPEDAALLARLRAITERLVEAPSASLPVGDADTERTLRLVKARLHDSKAAHVADAELYNRDVRVIPIRRQAPQRGLRRAALAAAAVVVAAVGVQLWRGRIPKPDAGSAAGTSGAITEFATRVGERDSIRLADGTRVLLGPGSQLSVAPGYGSTHREVRLRGEAYIDAAHEGAHPFVVRAGAATIRDVGTKFTVHGDGNTGVRVVVTEGAVNLRATAAVRDSGMLLRAGDVGVLAIDGTVVAERGRATEDDLAWTRGRLIFRDASMSEVRADLRRWYGIELVFADSALVTRHFSNDFVGDPPARVLQVIGMTLGVPVATHGDTTVIGVTPEATRRR